MGQVRPDRSSWTFTAELWEYPGAASWFFVSLPEDVADDIADLVDGRPRAGFGSVRVQVTIGDSRWDTSVFPDKSRGTYLLPVKKAVRKAEGLADGSPLTVGLELAV
jgi:hypothetical protein